MTGMKEGAGENPFADDPEVDEQASEADSVDVPDTDTERVESVSQQSTVNSSSDVDFDPNSSNPIQIPYKFRRDGVQDGRDRVPLFLHAETKRAERDALRELEDRFGEDVSLTDLREGLVKAGLSHLDDVEGTLEEWGYGMTFDN